MAAAYQNLMLSFGLPERFRANLLRNLKGYIDGYQ